MTDEYPEDYYEQVYGEGKRPASAGGCWICHEGVGYEDDDMAFDIHFDCWYHPECLPDDCSSVLEYEKH